MKKMMIGGLFLLLMGMAACGGGSSGGGGGDGASQAAQTAMTNSYETFETIMNSNEVAPCANQTQTTCTCPGGGSVATSDTTMTFTSCVAAAASAMVVEKATSTNRTFTGSLTSADASHANGTFSVFGDCTNATGTDMRIDGVCGGTIAATCSGESVTGTVVDKSGGGCTLQYSGGGGGDTLDAARTQLIYEVSATSEMMGTMIIALIQELGTCAGGQVTLSGTPVACNTSGTITLNGTVACTFNAGVYTVTSITNGTMTANACAGPAFNVDGTNYSITQTTTNAAVSMTNMTIDVTGGATPMMTGAASVAFNPMTLGGDITATLVYTQGFTMSSFQPPDTNPPSCAATSVSVTESGKTGTCTIAANCSECS